MELSRGGNPFPFRSSAVAWSSYTRDEREASVDVRGGSPAQRIELKRDYPVSSDSIQLIDSIW